MRNGCRLSRFCSYSSVRARLPDQLGVGSQQGSLDRRQTTPNPVWFSGVESILAALSGHRELVALLLDNGADREARDNGSGATPLYQASAWGRTAVVELLIARGADVNAKNKAGGTPLQAALSNGSADAIRILNDHGAR